MKNKLFLVIILLSVLLPLAVSANEANVVEKRQMFTKKDVTIAIDAFHNTFYNPEMKLYTISSETKEQAAISVQIIYWNMIMNVYKRTQEPKYRQLIADIYQGGYEQYDKYNWDSKIEWFNTAAIFVQNAMRLIEDCGQSQYMDWLRYNIDIAWNNRDKDRNITFKDVSQPCPTGILESYDASTCPALMQVISPR